MVLPLAVAFFAVLLGALLALGPREGAPIVLPIRLVAIVAAGAVIATHLLPEAFHELGLRAALGVAAGAAFPALTEFLGGRIATRPSVRERGARVGLEVAYGGLLVHRFGDGLSMGAVSGAHPSVVFAIALHIVPVTTVMLLAVESLLGKRRAVVRAVPLALSTMGGVVAARMFTGQAGQDESALSPWISAVVAGLLLHIVSHDVPRRRHAHAPGPVDDTGPL